MLNIINTFFEITLIQSFVFRNTLNHFIFQKFIPCIYDVEHHKHFFLNHNNLVIPKKRKKIQKNNFHSNNKWRLND